MIGATIAVNGGEAALGLASQRSLGEHCMTGHQYGAGQSCTLASAGPLRGGSGGQWPTDQQWSAYRAIRR